MVPNQVKMVISMLSKSMKEEVDIRAIKSMVKRRVSESYVIRMEECTKDNGRMTK